MLDEKKQRLYVSLWGRSWVAVIDLKTKQVAARWTVEAHPNEILLTKSGRHLFDRHDGDVLGQMPVDREPQPAGRKLRLRVEVGDVASRRDAGVGSAAAVERNLGARDSLYRRCQCALYRGPVRLKLPAGVGRAIKLYRQFQVAHDRGLIPDTLYLPACVMQSLA